MVKSKDSTVAFKNLGARALVSIPPMLLHMWQASYHQIPKPSNREPIKLELFMSYHFLNTRFLQFLTRVFAEIENTKKIIY